MTKDQIQAIAMAMSNPELNDPKNRITSHLFSMELESEPMLDSWGAYRIKLTYRMASYTGSVSIVINKNDTRNDWEIFDELKDLAWDSIDALVKENRDG